MEMNTQTDQLEPATRTVVRQFRDQAERFLQHQPTATCCDVEIGRRGRYIVLDGKVDSHGTKARLFGMVPRIDGRQWIVDRLRIDPCNRS